MPSVTDEPAASDSGAPVKRRRSLTLSLRLAILIAVLLVASAAITTLAVFRSVQSTMRAESDQSVGNIHSSVSALEFGKLFEKAGFPPGVVNIVTGFGADVGEPLIKHPNVSKVAFTGGDKTGERVYALAAQGIKKVTLELGGKSANIVFDDAQIDEAVKGVVSGIFAATGQTCIAGSRALVHKPIYDAFVEKLLALAKTAKMGNPMDASTQVGPVTNLPQLEKILSKRAELKFLQKIVVLDPAAMRLASQRTDVVTWQAVAELGLDEWEAAIHDGLRAHHLAVRAFVPLLRDRPGAGYAMINGAAAPGFSSGQAVAAMQRVADSVLPKDFGYEWTGITFQSLGRLSWAKPSHRLTRIRIAMIQCNRRATDV